MFSSVKYTLRLQKYYRAIWVISQGAEAQTTGIAATLRLSKGRRL